LRLAILVVSSKVDSGVVGRAHIREPPENAF
jgi:hypothetical protein